MCVCSIPQITFIILNLILFGLMLHFAWDSYRQARIMHQAVLDLKKVREELKRQIK